MLHQIDRKNAELLICGKDEKSIQCVDILFNDKVSSKKISISEYLEKAGLIKQSKPVRAQCVYDVSELLQLIENARTIDLSDASHIQRPFENPSDFLSSNAVAKKHFIQA